MRVDRSGPCPASPTAQPPSATAPAGRRFTLVSGETPPPAAPATAAPAGPLSPGAPGAPATPNPVARTLTRLLEDERKVDAGLRAATSGRLMSAQELITLQAQVIQYSQELEVVSRVVDKAAGAVKQTLQTQL